MNTPIHKILVADDSEAVVQIAELVLADAGYEVITARNGYEALNAIKNNKLSLVLLDRKMPMFDGDDLLPMIVAGYKNLPVVIITANVSEDSRKDCLANGASAYLTKPLNIVQLLDTVEELLAAKK